MKNIKLLFTLVLMTITVLATSCSDWLDDISPRHAIPQSALTDDDLEKLLNGVYATMENYTFTFWWLDDIQGENFKAGPGGGQITDPCEMSPSYTNQAINILSFWRNSFTTLHQVNFLVETYEASENKESALMKKVGGVSYYFRAFIYYRLASHYGNVPILRKRSKEVVPISPEAEVWTFIEEDLGKAIRLLSKADSKWYVSSDAANALAARVALFQNKMTDAANYAEAVLANSSFSLASTAMDFSKNWVAGSSSPEIIFAYVNNSRASSPLNFTLYVNDTDGSWNYAPSDWCYNSLFADDNTLSRKGDVRLKATFTSQDANRVMKKRYTTAPSEAAIKALSDKEYQTLILDERRREFYAEGMRWQDIKRTNRLELLETLDGRTYLMYYPIPQDEIDMAGTVAYPQNPGYAGYTGN